MPPKSQSRLRPFFPWFGSKWLLSPHYPAPIYDRIIEPFAGSAQYSLLYHDREIILCDIKPEIVKIWRYLIGVSEREFLALPRLERHVPVTTYGLSEGATLLLGSWMKFGKGSIPTVFHYSEKTYPWKWNQSSRREKLAAQLHYIKHWKITQKDYKNLDTNQPATWFVDSPYESKKRSYRTPPLDFPALGEWCKRLPGQAIVCEMEPAKWLPFRPFRETKSAHKTSAKGTKQTYRELIWTDTPPGLEYLPLCSQKQRQ